MCGRYTLTASAREIAETFGSSMDADLQVRPRYILAPTQMAPVVVWPGTEPAASSSGAGA